MSHKWSMAAPIGSCQRCGMLWVDRKEPRRQKVRRCRRSSIKAEPASNVTGSSASGGNGTHHYKVEAKHGK